MKKQINFTNQWAILSQVITKRHNSTVTPLRGTATLALVLICTLIATACGGGSGGSGGPVATPASGASTSPTRATSNSLVSTPVSKNKSGSLNCQAIVNAAFDFNSAEPVLLMLTAPGGSTAVNRVDSPLYVDTAKLQADLDVLAALPDPTEPIEISTMGKPSEAIQQFHQLLDLIDKVANSNPALGATPSADGAATDQQLLDFGTKYVKISTAITYAVSKACPDVSANVPQAQLPTSHPTPLTASNRIGQTAAVGDLRVTLDKVVTLPGADANLPAPGNHFVFAYFTVENIGKATFQVNTLTGTHLEDTAGKQYFFDPDTIMLDPNTTNFDGGIEPGAKKSGAVGYQLPKDAGDLVWVFEDFKPNRALFSVKASDIAAVGTPVTEPTEDAMRSGASATQTAFVEMALNAVSADATQAAAGTDGSAPPAPVATDVPPDATDTTDTADATPPPDVTDTPEAADTTDTPVTP